MRYSKLFGKTNKSDLKDNLSINAKFLIRGGFIDQLMSGSYTLLPLGLRVIKKIEQVIREEMNNTGAQEALMPLLHPKEIWNETGRWDSAKEVMYQFKKDEKEYALSFTHEEIVLDLIRKHVVGYKDLPVKMYHFSTKFRAELRAKSGILRGREFLMKDLYSAHATEEDLDTYYWEVAESYKKIFTRLGLIAKVVEAAGGVFTDNKTHEFQVLSGAGEDTIYHCDMCDFAQNLEISEVKTGDKCPKCEGTILESPAIEAGNIFKFGTSYCKKMNVTFADSEGKKQFPHFGSYGIGLTRLMGILVEAFNDDKGIVWPKAVAPYAVHLISLNTNGDALYEKLKESDVEVLYDDREDVSAGGKFADADLIGIPVRVVISARTQSAGSGHVEVKMRNESEAKLMTVEELLSLLKS